MNSYCSSNSISDFKRGMEGFETNENEGHYCNYPQRGGFATPNNKSTKKKKKKILGERNEEEEEDSCFNTPMIVCSPPPVRYDPVTNFTSPRPEFLRYNPNRRREILERMEDRNGTSASSEEEDQEASLQSSASPSPLLERRGREAEEEIQEVESDGSDDDGDTEEEEVVVEMSTRCSMVWKLLLLFGLFFVSCRYLFPSTPLQEIEGLRELTVPRMRRNSIRGDLLRAHIGLSDTCLGSREQLTCPIGGAAEETGVASLVTGDEGLNNDDDSVMPNEVTGDEDALVAIEEGADEVAISVHDDQDLPESLEDDVTGLENEQGKAMAVALTGTEVEETVNFTEFLEIPYNAPAPCVQQDGQDPDSETAYTWNHRFVFFSREVQLLFTWISVLAAAWVGLLRILFKYFAKPMPELPLPRSKSVTVVEESTDGCVDEKMIEPRITMEESSDTNEDSWLSTSSLDRLREKYVKSNAARQPTLRLLGEFSIAGIGGGQNFQGVEPEASSSSSKLLQSGRKKGSEESHISESQRRSSARNNKKKSISISDDKVHTYLSSTEFTLDVNNKTQQKKLPRTEDSGSKSEEKLAATPLRRSDRLRKRVASP